MAEENTEVNSGDPRAELRKNPVRDITADDLMSTDSLVKAFSVAGGFSARHLATGVDILENMARSPRCYKILSTPACVFATGLRGVMRELVKRKLVDMVITTCGMLDHDLARTWQDYYHGEFLMDDARLREMEVNRLGNVLVPDESYGTVIEEGLRPIIQGMWDRGMKDFSTAEFNAELGKAISTHPRAEESVLYWAWKNEIPVIVPGPTDGSVGAQLWMFYQEHRALRIDLLKDEQLLSDIMFKAEETGALMIGGGISKHHTIWWNQFRDGLNHAVYVTTAIEYDGSLSGARMREAVSWGKLRADADHVTVDGDATIILPLMVGALLARLG